MTVVESIGCDGIPHPVLCRACQVPMPAMVIPPELEEQRKRALYMAMYGNHGPLEEFSRIIRERGDHLHLLINKGTLYTVHVTCLERWQEQQLHAASN